MSVSYTANAKANRNDLAADPRISVTRWHGVDDEDWEDPQVVASRSGPIGSRPGGAFDPDAADATLASMGYQRTGPWVSGDPPNLGIPRGQWAAEVRVADVTDEDIRGLRDEALAAGDFDQAALCEAALSRADDHPGKVGRAYAEARRKCAEVILRVRWQATDKAWRATEDTSCDCGGGHA